MMKNRQWLFFPGLYLVLEGLASMLFIVGGNGDQALFQLGRFVRVVIGLSLIYFSEVVWFG